jgi:hypothetical protein
LVSFNPAELEEKYEKPRKSICGEHCRTTGQPCQNFQMPNGRCRMHGGLSTGRPIVSGMFTHKAKAQRAQLLEMIKSIKERMK